MGDAEEAQNAAEEAIQSALADIASARNDLGFIQSEMEAATTVSDKTFENTNTPLKLQRKSCHPIFAEFLGRLTLYTPKEEYIKE